MVRPGGHIDGSPAHAGIDPAIPSRTGQCTRGDRPQASHQRGKCLGRLRLPRTRGDRPSHNGSHSGDRPLAHVSGSPAHAGIDPWSRPKDVGALSGSPAHAGIDPAASVLDTNGLPRTRGDRPVFNVAPLVESGGLPRTRGDRPVRRKFQTYGASSWGSPAHAGIDPSETGRLPGSGRDAPAPPHTRG